MMTAYCPDAFRVELVPFWYLYTQSLASTGYSVNIDEMSEQINERTTAFYFSIYGTIPRSIGFIDLKTAHIISILFCVLRGK